jgi:hypothetical protein
LTLLKHFLIELTCPVSSIRKNAKNALLLLEVKHQFVEDGL